MTFCFLSPGTFTGGPMALHQAAANLNALGGRASVMYITDREIGAGDHAFAQYGNQIYMRAGLRQSRPDAGLKMFDVAHCKSAARDSHFILPELWPDMAAALIRHGCPNVYLWWLSVDNFPLTFLNQLANQQLIRQCHNLCQSAYAADFLQKNGASRISMLSDYIDLTPQTPLLPCAARDIDIAYLPAKARGAETQVECLRAQYNVVALQDMSREQVLHTLSRSKIFLDFGHHPGKDRVPREAALCGAIPMVRHVGAARFPADVPLPKALLLPTEVFFQEEMLLARIKSVLAAPERFEDDLNRYRSHIQGQKAVFETELKALLQRDQGNAPRKNSEQTLMMPAE